MRQVAFPHILRVYVVVDVDCFSHGVASEELDELARHANAEKMGSFPVSAVMSAK
jgi:hypothetical protein